MPVTRQLPARKELLPEVRPHHPNNRDRHHLAVLDAHPDRNSGVPTTRSAQRRGFARLHRPGRYYDEHILEGHAGRRSRGDRCRGDLRGGVRSRAEQSHVGDNVELRTTAPIYAGSGDVIPDGVTIYGTVTEARGGGRIAGAPELALRYTDIEVDGNRYPIRADQFRVRGKNDALQSAAEIGGGAVAGGVLGRVIGGKGGTAPGAVAGAVIGTGVAVATDGDQLVLPAGQKLRIRLGSSVRVTYHPESETKTQ